MNKHYIDPNQAEIMGITDSQSIQNAVDHAHRTGVNCVCIPRLNERTGKDVWEIDQAIILPSDMEIVLDNCVLRQADGSFDNVFRNFGDIVTEGHTMAEQRRNIVIRGQGNAVIDGGNYNGLSEKTSGKNGYPHITRNNAILFYNIRNFVLENFQIRNQRWWAINLIHAEQGRISNLNIEGQCHCANQDGIDLRVGCSEIIIEKITGQAGDDMIALSAIGNSASRTGITYMYRVEGHDEDIHDILIRDLIATSVECAVIALRNSDGRKIYNVTMDNIHCTDHYALQDGKKFPEYPTYKINPFDITRNRKGNSPYALIRVGQSGYFGKRDSILGELYNLHATNLHADQGCVILANVALQNCYFGNIYAGNDVDYIFTTKSARVSQRYGADLKNVVIENVFYDNVDNDHATAFDLDINDKECRAENLFVRTAFLGNCKNAFHVACDGEIRYRDVHGTHIEQEDGSARRA